MFNKENVNKYKIKIIDYIYMCVCVYVHSPATLLGTHVQLLGNKLLYSQSHGATQCI